jgi:hypothetical protein
MKIFSIEGTKHPDAIHRAVQCAHLFFIFFIIIIILLFILLLPTSLPLELKDASDVDEDDEDLDAVLQPGRYKVKATTQPTGKATAAKQMSREELMGEIYGKKTPRGRKRKADSVPAPKTTAKSKRTGDEPSAIEQPDRLDDEPSASVGSVLKRSRPTATSAKGKDVLPVDSTLHAHAHAHIDACL